MTIELSEAAVEHIVSSSYDPAYGARPLKRFLQHSLETKLARALIAGEIEEGNNILVDLAGEELLLKSVAESGEKLTTVH